MVDAGFSQIAYDGAPLHLQARATGGAPPYAFAWSAPAGNFTDPASSAPDFLTNGLPIGDITLALTITDSIGAMATDTVREHVDQTRLLVEKNVTIVLGVPDEPAGVSEDGKRVSFIVPTGYGTVTATLSWPDAASVLYLDLQDSSSVTVASDRSGASPLRATATAPTPGAWTAIIRPYSSTGTTAHLVVRALNTGALPTAYVGAAPYWESAVFGRLDAQKLRAFPSGGIPPYAVAWDADGDGIFEISGENATFTFPGGDRNVSTKVTDGAGFETLVTTPIRVEPSIQRVTYGICGGATDFPLWTMEFSASRGTCWIHGGHHSYFMGDHAYALRELHGFAFDVEQQFAPSLPDPAFITDPLHRQLSVEVSLDGRSWTTVGSGQYGYVTPADPTRDTYERQNVFFDIVASGQPFRFLRVHNPLSLSEGLSGYLDHTQLRFKVDDLGPVARPASGPATRSYSCDASDNMEAFFATHPCWFGGIDRYDAASFYATYFLGENATLDRATGTFQLAPFRDDDFTAGTALASARFTKAYVQTSVDGRNWTTQATVNATYGVPQAFDLTLPHVDARFIRFFPEYHALFDLNDSRHHPRAYFLQTDVTVTGLLPAASS